MGKIVAVGGGEIGRPGYPIETLSIDKETVRLTGKKHPKLLFLPTASGDSTGYTAVVEKYFSKLGCEVTPLYLFTPPSRQAIAKSILGADIIYVGGGNTLKMMKQWRALGVDTLLRKAHEKGTVLSGVSAGAVCWFHQANSDSLKMVNPDAPYIKVRGLDLVPALACPHYDFEPARQADLKAMMRKTAGVALAINNCAALEIIDDKYRVIASKQGAQAYKVFWKQGQYHQEPIKPSKVFQPLDAILTQ